MKLRSVRKADLPGLRRHCFADRFDPVTDIYDGRLTRRVQITPPVCADDPASIATRRHRKLFAEIARKKKRHGNNLHDSSRAGSVLHGTGGACYADQSSEETSCVHWCVASWCSFLHCF